MRLKIVPFLKAFGLRQAANLQNPRLIPIAKLELPLESIFHFFVDNKAARGPTQTDPLFNRLQGKTYLEHVTELVSFEGNPRQTALKAPLLINEFRRTNRFFKPLMRDQALPLNQQNTLIVNYNLLPALYRYQDTFKAHWFRWSNEHRTFWTHVAATHRRFGWNQFVEVHLPENMPSLSEFRRMASGQPAVAMEALVNDAAGLEAFTMELMQAFGQDSQLNLLDLYNWLGNRRETSLMSVVPPEAYEKLNLLFRVQGSFFVINLGQLDEWRKNPEATAEVLLGADGKPRDLKLSPLTEAEKLEIAAQTKGLDGEMLQRRFLSLIAAMIEFKAGNSTLLELDPVDAAQHQQELVDHSELPDAKAPGDDEEEEESAELPTAAAPLFEELELMDLDFKETTYTPPDPELFKTQLVVETDELAAAKGADGTIEPTAPVRVLRVTEEPEVVRDAPPLLKAVVKDAHDMYRVGLISAGTFERAIEDAQSYQRIPNPFGEGTIEEAMQYQESDYQIPADTAFRDSKTVFDKSMLSSKLQPMQRKYIKTLLPKDILNCVVAAQKQGAALLDYKVTEVKDLMNHYQIHKIVMKPVRGKASPLMFKIPVIDDDGRFRYNGVTYRQRLQRGDKPIRKVSPTSVALTSYYNKTFVFRSKLAANNFDEWLCREIRSRNMDEKDSSVHDVQFAELIQSEYHLPRIYTLLGSAFRALGSNQYNLYFRYKDRVEHFEKTYGINVASFETPDMVVVGAVGKDPILLDFKSQFYLLKGGDLEPLGDVCDLIGIDQTTASIEAVVMSVSNKDLPVGFVIAYQSGLTKLLETLGVTYTRHARAERLTLSPDNYVLTFMDEKLVFSRNDYKATLVLAGFLQFRKSLVNYSIYDFDRKDVYYRLMEDKGMNARYLREIESLYKSWMDPITEGILLSMDEPTDFEALLYRSVELLMTDWSPSEVDGAYMRYRGYERMAGTIYNELTASIKRFRARNTDVQIQMDPHEIWRRIVADPTVATIEDANPIAQIREQEAMTYRGAGGRGSQSMVARTRIYNEADLGVVSESTVDSGDVGVIAYLTQDPNFTDMRYNSRPFDHASESPGKLLSTCSQLAVASTNDDSKRIAFISIQQQQGVYADGYSVTPLRTGGEGIVAQRTGDMFAGTAEQDGVVKSITEHGIIVQYLDGSERGWQLGTRHGSAAGTNYPHSLVTDMVVGERFQKGDSVAYNEKYFAKDRLSPKQVLWKAGVMVTVAFSDNLDTLEDGSVVSEEVARQLNTQTTKVKDIHVRFDQNVYDVVKVGDKVDLESILCIIEDPEAGGNTLFDDSTRAALMRMSAFSPTSGVVGEISKIEVFYHGDLEDMSGSLAKLAKESDKQRLAIATATGGDVYTGEVDEDFRTGGEGLELENMVIRVYIDHDVPFVSGDKAVVCNQMKTVASRVMVGTNKTADGRDIGLIFGNTSVEERMVLSPKIIACYSILQLEAGKHVAGVFRGTSNAKAQ
jgi:hypothetical protein